jgi:dienelactone hydrolase
MCDDNKKVFVPYEGLTRRRFTALAAVAGVMGATGPAFAQAAVTERDTRITTPDGSCDAVFFHPSGSGTWPGVLAWPDAGGLPPSKRDMGCRLAAQGYFVLVVNPNSPHLLIEKISARYLVCVARNDDTNDPKAKKTLRETLTKTGRTATVEVYGGNHRWCVPDNGQYLQAVAERAWAALGAMYKTALV